MSSRHQ